MQADIHEVSFNEVSFNEVSFKGDEMYRICDGDGEEYYSAVYEEREEAVAALEELCYQDELDIDFFRVVKLSPRQERRLRRVR